MAEDFYFAGGEAGADVVGWDMLLDEELFDIRVVDEVYTFIVTTKEAILLEVADQSVAGWNNGGGHVVGRCASDVSDTGTWWLSAF